MKRLLVIAAALAAFGASAATAIAEKGDLYIAGNEAPGDNDVIRMDPKTGDVQGVAELPGGDGDHAAFGADGRLYVSDESSQLIFRVNVKTGDAEVFAEHPDFQNPFSLDVGPDGRLVVADFNAETVFGFKPPSSSATAIAAGGNLDNAEGIAVGPNGAGYVSLFDAPTGILGLDLRTGAQRVLTTFADGTNEAEGITVAPNGIVYLARHTSIERYVPRTDVSSNVSSGGGFQFLFDLELGFDGMLYVADQDATAVHRVNPKTGSQSIVGETGLASGGIGLAVEPPRCFRRSATVVGTEKKEKVKGSKGDDIIATLGGKDKVNGKGGNDRVCAGKGKDKVKGGKGKDKLKGQGGRDKLNGGPGKDKEKQ